MSGEGSTDPVVNENVPIRVVAREWQQCRSRRLVTLARVAVIVALATSAFAQNRDDSAPRSSDQTTLTLTDQLDLARLVDMGASRLRVNIEYDAAVVKGVVTLRLGSGVTDEHLWELMNQLLASRGFTTIRVAGRGEVLSVVKIEQAAGLARIEPQGLDSVRHDAEAPGPPVVPASVAAGYSTVMQELIELCADIGT